MNDEVVSHDILLWNEGQPDNDRGRDTYASMMVPDLAINLTFIPDRFFAI